MAGADPTSFFFTFRVASFGDVPSGSYLMKGAPGPLPKQTNDAALRAKVVALLDKLTVGGVGARS